MNKTILIIVENFSRSKSIINGVHLGVHHLPNNLLAPIILGFISGTTPKSRSSKNRDFPKGTGSSFVTYVVLKLVSQDSTPSEFSKPTFSSKSAITCTLVLVLSIWMKTVFEYTTQIAKIAVIGFLISYSITMGNKFPNSFSEITIGEKKE